MSSIQHPVQQTASVPPTQKPHITLKQMSSSSEEYNRSIEQIAEIKINFSYPNPEAQAILAAQAQGPRKNQSKWFWTIFPEV